MEQEKCIWNEFTDYSHDFEAVVTSYHHGSDGRNGSSSGERVYLFCKKCGKVIEIS